ncbi:MAG: hypothetical protein C7B43_00575 [Sulfobacillus benefaciens]|uniref:Uncharacterized protein n=1 Tax=Sulfobacillus benefaciens TaxID=453960 RepID=A0A2T2XB51_9FIRM|nr:MAG: hypothetical protein C7B43_00575 [Sulfobacillus benefaciens]
MFTWCVFTFWLAAAILILAGFGQSVLEFHGISRCWAGFVMVSVLLFSLMGFLWYPSIREGLGNYLWCCLAIALFVKKSLPLWGQTGITTVALALIRHLAPLNPHRVMMVNWMVWESVAGGLLPGLVTPDPLWSALSAAAVTSQSGTILSVMTGHLHVTTTRDLAFSLAATMIAWSVSWVLNEIANLWRTRHVHW